MKSRSQIITFLLLIGLLLSIYQYYPLAKGELSSLDKTELSKKAKEASENSPGDEDADPDDDLLDNEFHLRLSNYLFNVTYFTPTHLKYSFHLINNPSPPPKFQA